jgi:hypothetical protein
MFENNGPSGFGVIPLHIPRLALEAGQHMAY